MRLHAVCYYRSKSEEWTDDWRDLDFKARNLVQAVKHRDFNGHSDFRSTDGRSHRVDNTPDGRRVALEVAGSMIRLKMQRAGYQDASIIPIPASDHIDPGLEFTGSRLASAICDSMPGLVAHPILYFNQPVPKSSAGGGRNEALIQASLRLTTTQRTAGAVLIDDVYTTGAHLRAAYRFLIAQGMPVVDAFMIGKTAWERPINMFRVDVEELTIPVIC